jgi:hypothetical protein
MIGPALPVDALIQPAGLRPSAERLGQCPDCGRWIKRPARNRALPYHYNPGNPPLYGAWEGCPGPTPEQKAYAAKRYPHGDPERARATA